MTLTTITPAAVEPVLVADLKAQVRQDFAVDDAILTRMLASARAFVENYTRLRLITQEVEFRRDGLGGLIDLPIGPVQEVTEITYLDSAGGSQVLAPELWRVRKTVFPWQIIPAHLATWPSVLPDFDTVGITMTVGFGDAGSDVPPDIIGAILSMAAHLYEHREAVVSGAAVAQLPLGVQDMLRPHILWV